MASELDEIITQLAEAKGFVPSGGYDPIHRLPSGRWIVEDETLALLLAKYPA